MIKSNKFVVIEIEFKNWTCVIKLYKYFCPFFNLIKNMETADTYLGSPKNSTGTKRRFTWSLEDCGSTREIKRRRGGRRKGKGLSEGAVYTPAVDLN